MKYYVKSKLSENIHETPEGFLLCIGVPIARTGEMVYGEGETPLETDDEGKILIDREEEEVFSPRTMASFEGKAVTITHPTEFLNPDNWSRLAKGIMQNVRRGTGENKDDLIADLLITDKMAINLVKNGLREVSCGYEAEYTQVDEGRGMQTRIIGNHLALVEQGRAGSSYAINDHKGKGTSMKLQDRIKAIFAKAQDEAMKVADEAESEPTKKDEKAKDAFPDKKDDKAKDESAEKKDDAKKSEDAYGASMDEMKKMIDALGAKMEGMMKQKDASSQPTENEPAKVDAKDDDVAASLEDRLKAVEAAVQKLLESQSAEDDGDLITDEDAGEEAESEDDDFEESTMTGDEISRIEILAPGFDSKQKDAKVKALKVAFATDEGKKILKQLNGGKSPTFDSADNVNMLFVAASELLKASRKSDLSKTKQARDSDSASAAPKGAMSAEQMNEINAKHYALN